MKKRTVLPAFPRIVIDSREPVETAYEFFGLETMRAPLPTADVSLENFIWTIAFERKTADDWAGSIIPPRRELVMAEMERLSHFQVKALVIEASLEDLLEHRYTSQASPQSVVATAFAIQHDFGIPVVFAGSRAQAERFMLWSFERFWKKQHARRAELKEVAAP